MLRPYRDISTFAIFSNDPRYLFKPKDKLDFICIYLYLSVFICVHLRADARRLANASLSAVPFPQLLRPPTD